MSAGRMVASGIVASTSSIVATCCPPANPVKPLCPAARTARPTFDAPAVPPFQLALSAMTAGWSNAADDLDRSWVASGIRHVSGERSYRVTIRPMAPGKAKNGEPEVGFSAVCRSHAASRPRRLAPFGTEMSLRISAVPALAYDRVIVADRTKGMEKKVMDSQIKPSIVAHCDWGKDPGKRWMAVAMEVDGAWQIAQPERVGQTETLVERLKNRSRPNGKVFLGFDFPIGLPAFYGEATGLENFRAAIRTFGSDRWADWYEVCETASEVTIERPFYPMRPGGKNQQHLLTGLGAPSRDALLRRCERRTQSRPAACMLFWTLGGNQVGKGAITGWREVIAPNIDEVGLWPFDGPLDEIFDTRDVVFAETYPGDAYGQIGIPRRPIWSKRRQDGRQIVAGTLIAWLETRAAAFHPALADLIRGGFGPGPAGEDPFDALVGLMGMLDVVEGRLSPGNPVDPVIGRWEGWILGQRAEG